MPPTDSHLVSVVIPAYNAQDWIGETLASVRGQTHRALEIIVVDDGSTDATTDIVDRHVRADPRVRIIRQPNAGVAAARNNGWRNAAADLIAFVDADDLWAATKIERQVEAIERIGPAAGLAYCFFVVIDDTGKVVHFPAQFPFEGEVLFHIFHGNFIGNGSAALIRREALERVGGFESGLHRAGAQGCEDYMIYCRIAEHYQFAVVPEPLLGYRSLPGNMSSNMARMMRSWLMVVDEMLTRHPDRRRHLLAGTRFYLHWLLTQAIGDRNIGQYLSALAIAGRRYPSLVPPILAGDCPMTLLRVARKWVRRRRGRRPAVIALPDFRPATVEA